MGVGFLSVVILSCYFCCYLCKRMCKSRENKHSREQSMNSDEMETHRLGEIVALNYSSHNLLSPSDANRNKKHKKPALNNFDSADGFRMPGFTSKLSTHWGKYGDWRANNPEFEDGYDSEEIDGDKSPHHSLPRFRPSSSFLISKKSKGKSKNRRKNNSHKDKNKNKISNKNKKSNTNETQEDSINNLSIDISLGEGVNTVNNNTNTNGGMLRKTISIASTAGSYTSEDAIGQGLDNEAIMQMINFNEEQLKQHDIEMKANLMHLNTNFDDLDNDRHEMDALLASVDALEKKARRSTPHATPTHRVGFDLSGNTSDSDAKPWKSFASMIIKPFIGNKNNKNNSNNNSTLDSNSFHHNNKHNHNDKNNDNHKSNDNHNHQHSSNNRVGNDVASLTEDYSERYHTPVTALAVHNNFNASDDDLEGSDDDEVQHMFLQEFGQASVGPDDESASTGKSSNEDDKTEPGRESDSRSNSEVRSSAGTSGTGGTERSGTLIIDDLNAFSITPFDVDTGLNEYGGLNNLATIGSLRQSSASVSMSKSVSKSRSKSKGSTGKPAKPAKTTTGFLGLTRPKLAPKVSAL